jgi:thymidylate synthase (FAD)
MVLSDIQVTYIDSCGSDLSVVNAARVSFHKVSEEFKDGDAKLINYLAKHKHFSPFNHSFLSFRVKAPIFVARQLVKHKFMPWNEVSRRYVDDEPEFYMPDIWRARADNVKQGSSDIRADKMYEEDFTGMTGSDWTELAMRQSLTNYMAMLSDGVAPEQARMVLPQNTMTEWIWSGTLGAFADMLRLRLDPHTQYESRIVATLIYPEIEKRFPVSIKALLGVA